MSTPRPNAEPNAPINVSADRAWAAIVARDVRFDGAFVYAVRTTGVYCRPACGARRPLRANVSLFCDADAAERAGFRACRRCRPRSSPFAPAETHARAAQAYLDAHLDETVSLAALARHVGVSPWHLQRTFARVVGASPKVYQHARRIERFKRSARSGASVTTALYDAGFGSSRGLYEHARDRLGMTPATFQRGGRGLEIRFTTAALASGRVLLAATTRGVCAVVAGRDDRALEAELRRDFPRAAFARDDRSLRAWVRAVVREIDGDRPAGGVPLDLHGTRFQLRVWNALRAIPRGQTRSYREIGTALGQPRSARAVGRACASNKVMALVPCHRVVREDGAPGGYRWGLARKKRMLARERSCTAQRNRRDASK
jgi:AraC family transcriptional regulator of adaptative response/methylated-DNA-[protein]-cysteine methyltransferase